MLITVVLDSLSDNSKVPAMSGSDACFVSVCFCLAVCFVIISRNLDMVTGSLELAFSDTTRLGEGCAYITGMRSQSFSASGL